VLRVRTRPAAGERARGRTLLLGLGVIIALGLAALLAIDVSVRVALFGHLYRDAASAPAAPVTLVLGAEVYPDGRPSPALQSRLDVAMELLRGGKTNLLLMSGGSGTFEVDAMRAYVVKRGVAPEVIALDGSGGRTLASCEAARARFPAVSILIVSQVDHVARATFICRRLGIDADGVAAPEFTGDRLIVYWIRERFALVLAWWEAQLR
jgi:vancomycin permeability regulator SanA